jgi:Cytochrome c554 and c-prime
MEQSSHGPLPIRHSFIHERGFLRFNWISGTLIFLALTGLAIWLLPFSVPIQVSVLMHTVLGLLIVIPLTLWQLSHWLASRKTKRSFRKICAYTGFWTMAVVAASGLVLTWQAVFGLYISHLWDQLHLWSGIAALPFLGYHVWPHARKAGENLQSGLNGLGADNQLPLPDFRPGRRHMWAVSGLAAVALVAVVGVITGIYRAYAPDFSSYKLPADYKMPYGKDPFAPSMAKTVHGGPVAPQLLAGSKSCGAAGCHTEIYHEWAADSHRWSSEDIGFQGVQAALIHAEGAPAARYCAGCHDPVSLLSGYKNASTSIEAPGFKEGASCVVCHAMRRVDMQGNGNYVWGPPRPYLFEYAGAGRASAVTHFLIRAYPRQHDQDYDLALDKNPASCGACHKQFIDKEINHVGWVQLQNQYDDWKHGKWNTDPNPAHRLRCQQCHMYYQKAPSVALADPYDLKTGLGLEHRNHWFAAANQWMPEVIHTPDAAGQTKRVIQWLEGGKYIPEIANVWPKGPVLPIRIVPPQPVRPGGKGEFRAVISNNKAGHSFPTGPLDLIRAWVEVKVSDQTGRIIFHSGELLPDDHLEPGTFVLKAEGVNAEGREIVRHDLWHYVGAKWKRAIFPGYSDMYEYHFTVPRNVKGPLTIAARLRYRKANQYFMDFAFPGQHLQTPITDLSSDRVQVPLASRGQIRAESSAKRRKVSLLIHAGHPGSGQ